MFEICALSVFHSIDTLSATYNTSMVLGVVLASEFCSLSWNTYIKLMPTHWDTPHGVNHTFYSLSNGLNTCGIVFPVLQSNPLHLSYHIYLGLFIFVSAPSSKPIIMFTQHTAVFLLLKCPTLHKYLRRIGERSHSYQMVFWTGLGGSNQCCTHSWVAQV